MRHNSGEWEKVGTVGVDAGIVWVGDPCYIVGSDASMPFPEWDDFCKALNDSGAYADNNNGVTEFRSGLGMAIESGYGDGEYNVYVKRCDDRIAEVRIVFINDPEDDEDEDDYYAEDEEEEDNE